MDRLYFLISIASIISRVGGGFLLDKTSERFVMAFGMLIQVHCSRPWVARPASSASSRGG